MAMTSVGDIKVPLAPVLSGDRVVAVGHAGHVHLIDVETGRTLWTRALAQEVGASACDGQPVSVGISDDVVIAGTMGHVFALRVDDGSVQWHITQRARGAGDTSLAIGGSVGNFVSRLES